jgi:hypothetical protein
MVSCARVPVPRELLGDTLWGQMPDPPGPSERLASTFPPLLKCSDLQGKRDAKRDREAAPPQREFSVVRRGSTEMPPQITGERRISQTALWERRRSSKRSPSRRPPRVCFTPTPSGRRSGPGVGSTVILLVLAQSGDEVGHAVLFSPLERLVPAPRFGSIIGRPPGTKNERNRRSSDDRIEALGTYDGRTVACTGCNDRAQVCDVAPSAGRPTRSHGRSPSHDRVARHLRSLCSYPVRRGRIC